MRTACIDVGLKRIGIAISLIDGVVTPLEAVIRRNRNQAAKDVSNLLKEWQIQKLIVGIPKGGSSEDEMRRRIEHFVSLLDFDKEIEYQDEYGSSKEAKELMKGITKNRRDGKLDSLSAKIILERYLGVTFYAPS